MNKTPNPYGESDEAAKARRMRNIALGVGLSLFVVVIFIVTLAKMGGHVFDAHL
jgi:hypothetical protein